MLFRSVFRVCEGVRCNEFGVPEDEENFQEAAKAVNTALTEVDVSPSLRQILDDDNASNITSEVGYTYRYI